MPSEPMLVELPGHHLYNEVRLQPFTYGDASVLSLLDKTNDPDKLFDIIDKRLNINVRELTIQDFWYTLYWQRINSYSSFPVKLPWTCNYCEHKNLDEMSGSSLIIEDLNPEYFHGIEIDFPDSGILKIRLKLIGDEIELRKYMKKEKIEDPTGEVYETLLTACMLEYNGGTLKERYDLVKNMSADDQFTLKSVEEYFDYGVKDYSEFTCENCKEVVKVGYELDLTSFFPSVQDKSSIGSRILFSKTSTSADRQSTECGSDESSIHSPDTHEPLKSTKRKKKATTKPAPSTRTEEVDYTPEDLQQMLTSGLKDALENDDISKFQGLEEIVKDR